MKVATESFLLQQKRLVCETECLDISRYLFQVLQILSGPLKYKHTDLHC